jgi:SnoaL-like protein
MSSDVIAITNVVNLYALALDSQKYELFDKVFTADAWVSFGGPAQWNDRALLKQAFDVIHAPYTATQHVTTNHHVTVNGDRATCLSYVVGRFIRPVEGGDTFESGGWYDDELVRTSEGWRIARRECQMSWWSGNPAVLQTDPSVHIEPAVVSLKDAAANGKVSHIADLLAS